VLVRCRSAKHFLFVLGASAQAAATIAAKARDKEKATELEDHKGYTTPIPVGIVTSKLLLPTLRYLAVHGAFPVRVSRAAILEDLSALLECAKLNREIFSAEDDSRFGLTGSVKSIQLAVTILQMCAELETSQDDDKAGWAALHFDKVKHITVAIPALLMELGGNFVDRFFSLDTGEPTATALLLVKDLGRASLGQFHTSMMTGLREAIKDTVSAALNDQGSETWPIVTTRKVVEQASHRSKRWRIINTITRSTRDPAPDTSHIGYAVNRSGPADRVDPFSRAFGSSASAFYGQVPRLPLGVSVASKDLLLKPSTASTHVVPMPLQFMANELDVMDPRGVREAPLPMEPVGSSSSANCSFQRDEFNKDEVKRSRMELSVLRRRVLNAQLGRLVRRLPRASADLDLRNSVSNSYISRVSLSGMVSVASEMYRLCCSQEEPIGFAELEREMDCLFARKDLTGVRPFPTSAMTDIRRWGIYSSATSTAPPFERTVVGLRGVTSMPILTVKGLAEARAAGIGHDALAAFAAQPFSPQARQAVFGREHSPLRPSRSPAVAFRALERGALRASPVPEAPPEVSGISDYRIGVKVLESISLSVPEVFPHPVSWEEGISSLTFPSNGKSVWGNRQTSLHRALSCLRLITQHGPLLFSELSALLPEVSSQQVRTAVELAVGLGLLHVQSWKLDAGTTLSDKDKRLTDATIEIVKPATDIDPELIRECLLRCSIVGTSFRGRAKDKRIRDLHPHVIDRIRLTTTKREEDYEDKRSGPMNLLYPALAPVKEALFKSLPEVLARRIPVPVKEKSSASASSSSVAADAAAKGEADPGTSAKKPPKEKRKGASNDDDGDGDGDDEDVVDETATQRKWAEADAQLEGEEFADLLPQPAQLNVHTGSGHERMLRMFGSSKLAQVMQASHSAKASVLPRIMAGQNAAFLRARASKLPVLELIAQKDVDEITKCFVAQSGGDRLGSAAAAKLLLRYHILVMTLFPLDEPSRASAAGDKATESRPLPQVKLREDTSPGGLESDDWVQSLQDLHSFMPFSRKGSILCSMMMMPIGLLVWCFGLPVKGKDMTLAGITDIANMISSVWSGYNGVQPTEHSELGPSLLSLMAGFDDEDATESRLTAAMRMLKHCREEALPVVQLLMQMGLLVGQDGRPVDVSDKALETEVLLPQRMSLTDVIEWAAKTVTEAQVPEGLDKFTGKTPSDREWTSIPWLPKPLNQAVVRMMHKRIVSDNKEDWLDKLFRSLHDHLLVATCMLEWDSLSIVVGDESIPPSTFRRTQLPLEDFVGGVDFTLLPNITTLPVLPTEEQATLLSVNSSLTPLDALAQSVSPAEGTAELVTGASLLHRYGLDASAFYVAIVLPLNSAIRVPKLRNLFAFTCFTGAVQAHRLRAERQRIRAAVVSSTGDLVKRLIGKFDHELQLEFRIDASTPPKAVADLEKIYADLRDLRNSDFDAGVPDVEWDGTKAVPRQFSSDSQDLSKVKIYEAWLAHKTAPIRRRLAIVRKSLGEASTVEAPADGEAKGRKRVAAYEKDIRVSSVPLSDGVFVAYGLIDWIHQRLCLPLAQEQLKRLFRSNGKTLADAISKVKAGDASHQLEFGIPMKHLLALAVNSSEPSNDVNALALQYAARSIARNLAQFVLLQVDVEGAVSSESWPFGELDAGEAAFGPFVSTEWLSESTMNVSRDKAEDGGLVPEQEEGAEPAAKRPKLRAPKLAKLKVNAELLAKYFSRGISALEEASDAEDTTVFQLTLDPVATALNLACHLLMDQLLPVGNRIKLELWVASGREPTLEQVRAAWRYGNMKPRGRSLLPSLLRQPLNASRYVFTDMPTTGEWERAREANASFTGEFEFPERQRPWGDGNDDDMSVAPLRVRVTPERTIPPKVYWGAGGFWYRYYIRFAELVGQMVASVLVKTFKTAAGLTPSMMDAPRGGNNLEGTFAELPVYVHPKDADAIRECIVVGSPIQELKIYKRGLATYYCIPGAVVKPGIRAERYLLPAAGAASAGSRGPRDGFPRPRDVLAVRKLQSLESKGISMQMFWSLIMAEWEEDRADTGAIAALLAAIGGHSVMRGATASSRGVDASKCHEIAQKMCSGALWSSLVHKAAQASSGFVDETTLPRFYKTKDTKETAVDDLPAESQLVVKKHSQKLLVLRALDFPELVPLLEGQLKDAQQAITGTGKLPVFRHEEHEIFGRNSEPFIGQLSSSRAQASPCEWVVKSLVPIINASSAAKVAEVAHLAIWTLLNTATDVLSASKCATDLSVCGTEARVALSLTTACGVSSASQMGLSSRYLGQVAFMVRKSPKEEMHLTLGPQMADYMLRLIGQTKVGSVVALVQPNPVAYTEHLSARQRDECAALSADNLPPPDEDAGASVPPSVDLDITSADPDKAARDGLLFALSGREPPSAHSSSADVGEADELGSILFGDVVTSAAAASSSSRKRGREDTIQIPSSKRMHGTKSIERDLVSQAVQSLSLGPEPPVADVVSLGQNIEALWGTFLEKCCRGVVDKGSPDGLVVLTITRKFLQNHAGSKTLLVAPCATGVSVIIGKEPSNCRVITCAPSRRVLDTLAPLDVQETGAETSRAEQVRLAALGHVAESSHRAPGQIWTNPLTGGLNQSLLFWLLTQGLAVLLDASAAESVDLAKVSEALGICSEGDALFLLVLMHGLGLAKPILGEHRATGVRPVVTAAADYMLEHMSTEELLQRPSPTHCNVLLHGGTGYWESPLSWHTSVSLHNSLGIRWRPETSEERGVQGLEWLRKEWFGSKGRSVMEQVMRRLQVLRCGAGTLVDRPIGDLLSMIEGDADEEEAVEGDEN
jgi:hypothetical protein